MSSTTRDDWVKNTMGADVNAAKTAAPTAEPLPAAGTSEQEKTFHDKLQQELSAIDLHLAYTAEHAEAAKHAPFAAQRGKLAATYQPAVKQIDPANEDKAKASIDKVLAAAKGVTGQVMAFRTAAEKAFNDWQARKPKYDETVKLIGEMQAWGHPKAAPLQKGADDVKAKVEAKAYAGAASAADQLDHATAPVADDYHKQREAQAKYEPDRVALDPRLQAAAACPLKTLAPLHQPFEAGAKAVDGLATAKNYVGALKSLGELTLKVDAFEVKRKEKEEQQKLYQTASDEAQQKAKGLSEGPQFKATKPLQDKLGAQRTQVDATAAKEDFVAAEKQAKELSGKADEAKQKVDEVVKQKQDYETERDKVMAKGGDVSQSTYKMLATQQAAIGTGQTAMAAKATNEDFAGAKKDAAALGVQIDTYVAARKQLDEFKAKFEKKRDTLKPKTEAIGTPPHPKLKDAEDQLQKAIPAAQAEADAERFDAGLAMLEDLEPKLTKYHEDVETLEQQKAAYKKAYEPAATLLVEAKKLSGDAVAQMQQSALKLDEDIQKQATDEDYDNATKNSELLERQLKDILAADNSKVLTVEVKEGPFKGTYAGTAQEIAAVRAALAAKIATETIGKLTQSADLHDGYCRDLENNGNGNAVVYVVAAIFNHFVGDLNSVKTACAQQKPKIEALRGAINGGQNAEPAFREAVKAVNDAGAALTTFLDKIDSGAKKSLPVLEAVRDTSFFVLAALATGGIAGSAAVVGTLGTTGASMAGAAGGAAITELGKKAEKFDNLKEVTLGEVVWDCGKAAAVAAVADFVGGKMSEAFRGQVTSKICDQFPGYLAKNPEIRGKIEKWVGKFIADKTKKVIERLYDPKKKSTSWSEIAHEVAMDFSKDKLKDEIEEWAKEKIKEEATAQ